MRYDELITDNTPLLEAQLTPGQIKDIKIKISDYEEELNKLRRKKNELDDKFVYGTFPPELQNKVDAYINAYTNAIDDLKEKIKQSNVNPQFDNLIAGIKKNCSEILDLYKQRNKVFYSGFNNATQPVLYAKPNATLNLDEYRSYHSGGEIQYLIELFYDNLSFDDAVLASSDSYEVSVGNKIPYMIFPRNGFKYFWAQESSMLGISKSAIYLLFDHDTLKDGWKIFVQDPEMFNKFKAAGADVPHTEEGSIGAYDGFMGKYTWENNLKALDQMHTDGTLPDGWDRMTNWISWVNRESFEKRFDMQNTRLMSALGNGHDCVINTSGLYAINFKFRRIVFNALGIGTY